MQLIFPTGYHWLRSVAKLFNVCVCVVIHNHPCVYVFGDVLQRRIHLYKRDVETHYDALPASVMYIGVALANVSAISASNVTAQSDALPDVMYTKQITASTAQLPSDQQNLQKKRFSNFVLELNDHMRCKNDGTRSIQKLLRTTFNCTSDTWMLFDTDSELQTSLFSQTCELLEERSTRRRRMQDLHLSYMDAAILCGDEEAVEAAICKFEGLQHPSDSSSEEDLTSVCVVSSDTEHDTKADIIQTSPRRSKRLRGTNKDGATVELATVLHGLEMATQPVCLQMALAMADAGVDLSCFVGLGLDDLHQRIKQIWPFSRLHARRIQAHLQTLEDGVHSLVALNKVPRAREPSATIAASGVHSLVALNKVPRAREPSATIAASGVHSLVALNKVPRAREPQLRQTAKVQSPSIDSDNEDDAPLRRKPSRPLSALPCDRPKKGPAVAQSVFKLSCTFPAKNHEEAKAWLIEHLCQAHSGAHPICRNST